MTLKVNSRTKAAREALRDIDYADKLSATDSAWLETFMRATAANSVDDMAALVGNDPRKLARLQNQIFDEDNARRRDITYVGSRLDVTDEFDGDQTAGLGASLGDVVRCGRCLQTQCECGPRFRLNAYGQEDYLPLQRDEDMMLSEIELAKRMQAFDLLPYGDAPKDLKVGQAVKVCLPHHLLDKALGYVLGFRPVSGEVLVRSMSKSGLKDKDGTRPRATVLYVKPNGLKRSRPELVKALSPSSDKKNGGTAA